MASIVMLFGFGAQKAQAQSTTYSCTNTTLYEGGTYSDSDCTTNNTANQASTVATSTAVLKAASTQSAGLVSDRINNALGGGSSFNVAANGFAASTGVAAGGSEDKLGVWISGTYSDVEDDSPNTKFEGDVYSTMAGIDYKVSDSTLIGLAFGYESTEIDTEYNGSATQDGLLEADGYTIAPYIGLSLSESASANLTVGYSKLDYDTVRYDPNTSNRITGSTDAERYFVDASVAGTHMYDENWRVRGKVGVFYASEEKDAFTETETGGATIANASTDSDLGQATLDVKLGYVYKQVEPYALAGVEYDFTKDEAPVAAGQTRSALDEEDFGAKFGAGLNFQLAPNITGSFEGYTVEFRDDYSEYTFKGGLRATF